MMMMNAYSFSRFFWPGPAGAAEHSPVPKPWGRPLYGEGKREAIGEEKGGDGRGKRARDKRERWMSPMVSEVAWHRTRCVTAFCYCVTIENLYSPSKHGRKQTISNTNKIKNTYSTDKKHSKLTSNLSTRLTHNTLGKEKSHYSWHYFIVSILSVVKSFMKNQLMTKLSDCKSDFVKGHASRPYTSTGKHLLFINWRVTSSEATRPIFEKTAFAVR